MKYDDRNDASDEKLSKADNGNEEVIDLSNAPKADGNCQSDKKRKPRRKKV